MPCAAELAAAGVTVQRELSGCRLSTMECGLNPEEQIAAIEADDDSFVRVHLERFNISLASGARLSFVRDLIDRPDFTEIVQACPLGPAPHTPPPPPRMPSALLNFDALANRLLPNGYLSVYLHPPLLCAASSTARGSSGRALCGRAK